MSSLVSEAMKPDDILVVSVGKLHRLGLQLCLVVISFFLFFCLFAGLLWTVYFFYSICTDIAG